MTAIRVHDGPIRSQDHRAISDNISGGVKAIRRLERKSNNRGRVYMLDRHLREAGVVQNHPGETRPRDRVQVKQSTSTS